MTFCRKSIWMLVAVAALLPAGCASQRGRMASKHPVNTAQLLAAARQYEKEGNLQSAGQIYSHVLQFHPGNSEASQGLALVKQGKLRVNYDPQQLLASTDPVVQKNPQARQQLAKIQQVKREQVNERMAELIAQAAQAPKTIKRDPTPTPAMVAAVTPTKSPTNSTATETQPTAPEAPSRVAQADAVVSTTSPKAIATTGFVRIDDEDVPADWVEPGWKEHSLTDKCEDANAAVLNEVKKLEHVADDVRKQGLTNLALMGPEAISASPAIRRLLNDPNQIVSAHAAWAIWEIDGDASTAINTLQNCLSSRSRPVVHFACYSLGHLGRVADSAAPQLRLLLTDADSLTRLHAAEALTRLTDVEQRADATDTLIVLLNDEERRVRHLAAMTLGQADEANAAAAVAALTEALNDDDAGVRSAAALSLGGFGTVAKDAIDRLETVSATDHTDVREAATTALNCIKL